MVTRQFKQHASKRQDQIPAPAFLRTLPLMMCMRMRAW